MSQNIFDKDAMEKKFVSTFVEKRWRERTIHELSNPVKRRDFFSKLCHKSEDMMIMKHKLKAPFSEKNEPSPNEMEVFLREKGAGEHCYLMSYLSQTDGQCLPLSSGIENCLSSGMSSVLICNDRLAVIFSEAEKSVPRIHIFAS